MGNLGPSAAEYTGQACVSCGCSNALGFEKSMELVIRNTGIDPWPARELVRARLERQSDLASRSVLRYIRARQGFSLLASFIDEKGRLSRDAFISCGKDLINGHGGARSIAEKEGTSVGPDSDELLPEIFSVLDYDEDGELSVGEMAIALVSFFGGSDQEKASALFQLLDRDRDGVLSRNEMEEYLAPLVRVMTPTEAASLRSLLLQRAVGEVLVSMGASATARVGYGAFESWWIRTNVVDELLPVVEGEVYKVWLQAKMRDAGGSGPAMGSTSVATSTNFSAQGQVSSTSTSNITTTTHQF